VFTKSAGVDLAHVLFMTHLHVDLDLDLHVCTVCHVNEEWDSGTDDQSSSGGPERRRQRSQPSARRRDASDIFIISLRTGRSRNSYLVVFFPLLSIWI